MAEKIIENQCIEVRPNEKDVAKIKTQTIGILKTLFPEESLSRAARVGDDPGSLAGEFYHRLSAEADSSSAPAGITPGGS